MIRSGGRTVGGLVLAACLLVTAGSSADASVGAATAVAAPSGAPCPTSDGVTVIVDFQGEGGRGLVTGCAPGSPSNGFVALKDAGFTIQGLSGGQPFLCRIDGQPTADTGEDCVGYPPTSAYWGYFHAPRGGSWTYASEGGGTRKPPPGTVDAWSFQRNPPEEGAIKPRTSPPAPPTTTTTAPRTTTTRPPSTPTTQRPTDLDPTPTTADPTPGPITIDGPTPTVADGSPKPRSTTTVAPAADGSSSTAAVGQDPGSSTTSAPTARDGDTGSDDEQAGVELAERGDGGGPPTGALVGGAAVLALGAVTALTVRRRRTAEAGLGPDEVLPPPGPGTG